jgi:ABC-type branched-subunit amino acid transport system substrate-binding protein
MAPSPKHTATTRRERLAIASRALAAVVGGYALASVAASALALALPLFTPASRADGVLIASLLSFVFYTAAAIWVFGTRSATRAWLGLAVASLACAVAWTALSRAG